MVERKKPEQLPDHYDPEIAGISATEFGFASLIDFPANVADMVILDIGSGASSSVSTLRKKGAMAIGIDYNYKDPAEFTDRAQGFINFNYSGYEKWREKRILNKSLKEIRKNEDFLIAGLAEELPLADESVDFAYSMFCMTVFHTNDYKTFTKAFSEAMRVLKPSGELQLAPWVDQDSNRLPFSQKQTYNARKFIKSLDKAGMPYSVEQADRGLLRLKITKP